MERWPLAFISAAALLAAHPDYGVVNHGFDAWSSSGALMDWTFSKLGRGGDYEVVRAEGEHGDAARLTATGTATAGVLTQRIDATAWRGKDVELSARVRIDGGAHVGLTVVVHRPEPNATGTRDQSGARDVAQGVWTRLRKLVHVDEDALDIDIGLGLAGQGSVLIDDYEVREAHLLDVPASPAAKAYLEAALARMRKEHLRRHELNWPLIEARAHREIAGAQSPGDTYWVIRGLIGTLGDKHSMFLPPAPPVPTGERRPPAPAPQVQLLDRRYGLIALPGVNSWGPTGPSDAARYVRIAEKGLERLDQHPLCGWIVDLRTDTGGDVWPMLNSIAPLLGKPPFSAVVSADGPTAVAAFSAAGEVVEVPITSRNGSGKAAWRLRQAALPVAVITSGRTASAGEGVVIALQGRPISRRFGEPTAGFTTANSGDELSDGAFLAIESGWGRDRLGREYKDRIDPDEASDAGAAVNLAVKWLAQRCDQRGYKVQD